MHALADIVAVAQPSDSSVSDLILQWLVALGISGVVTAALTAWLSRRKTAAEARAASAGADGSYAAAAATLTGSALSLIAPQQAQIARQEEQLEEQRQQIKELAGRIDRLEVDRERSHRRETELTDQLADTRTELGDCRAWMQLAYALITQSGLDIEPPPNSRRTRRTPQEPS